MTIKQQKFTRTSAEKMREMNAQNVHISKSVEASNFALLELMKLGITVESVHLERQTPEINVIYSGHCNKLNTYIFATVGGPGNSRETIKQANFCGCLVQWKH